MSSKETVYCWDSDVIIAWFAQEPSKPLGDMQLVVDEIVSGKARLVISMLAYAEVLEARTGNHAIRIFKQFTKRSDVMMAEVNRAVIDKAAELRENIFAAREIDPQACKKLALPDAIHIATSLIYKVDRLHSFDLASNWGSPDRAKYVQNLKICNPVPIQGHRSITGLEC